MLIIPMGESDNVTFFDAKKFVVDDILPLPAGSSPWTAKVTPDEKFGLVTLSNFNGDVATSPLVPSSVAVVKLSNQKLVNQVPVGIGPNQIAMEANGARAFVTNTRGNDVSVIDLNSFTTVATVAVGANPQGLAVTPDQTKLVVANFGDASLTFIDLSNLNVLSTLVVGNPSLTTPDPEFGAGDTVDFAVGPDGKGYATNWRSNTIVVIDMSGPSIIASVPSPILNPFSVETFDTQFLWVGSDFGGGTVLLNPFNPGLTVADTFDVTGVTPPSGPGCEFNVWMNDPKKDAMVVWATNGLDNVTVGRGAGPKIL